MAKYNRQGTTAKVAPAKAPVGVIGTKKSGARATTFEGHEGFERKDKSALFLLAAGSLGGEDKFYETGAESTKRLVDLVRTVAVKDPQWISNFLVWLRSEGNIRTAAVVGAVEAADAMVKAGIAGGRQILASVLQRGDEPGEALAYWFATRGRKMPLPKPIKRGIADAAERLYNEYSFLKYDSARAAVRFADVIDMVHPDPSQGWKSELFRYAIEKRHGRNTEPGDSLTLVRRQAEWFRDAQATPLLLDALLDSERIKDAGLTWEDVLSALGSKVDKAKLWKAILPNMGYMALIRNLRNMDEAKLSDVAVAAAIARIQDPEQVAKSRQLPYRFYSAYLAAPSLRWGHALDVALTHSLRNIPSLGGRTLILIDTSGSMSWTRISGNSERTCQEIAGLFGIALGLKGEADVWAWATGAYQFQLKGTSVLKNLEKYASENDKVGSGTDLAQAIRNAYVPGKYDRMVIISDGQVRPWDADRVMPNDIPVYFFTLAGYRAAAAQTKSNVFELGGLTDHTFKMITMLEAGESGKWPWEA